MNRYTSALSWRLGFYLLISFVAILIVGLSLGAQSSQSLAAGLFFSALSCSVFWRIGSINRPGVTAAQAYSRLAFAFIAKFAVFIICLIAALRLNLQPMWLLVGVGLALAFFVLELLKKN